MPPRKKKDDEIKFEYLPSREEVAFKCTKDEAKATYAYTYLCLKEDPSLKKYISIFDNPQPLSTQGEKVDIENGIYKAVWSGYNLKIYKSTSNNTLTIKTRVGIRCKNCKILVTAFNGIIYNSKKDLV